MGYENYKPWQLYRPYATRTGGEQLPVMNRLDAGACEKHGSHGHACQLSEAACPMGQMIMPQWAHCGP
jgi:hypothetical protein